MKKIGVLTSGGDAPGMNAAVRAVTRYGLSKGYEMMGIRRGYAGLVRDDIFSLDDGDVSGKINRGGTFLLTARSERFRTGAGQEEALKNLDSSGIDALVIIGGDGSLRGAEALEEQGIQTIGIPATIDNDIPCTDYAIGFDTAVNTVIDAVDKIRDTATSHERVFVVETMGRDNGLLTLAAGVAAGAESILIPEIQFDLNEVCERVAEGYRQGKLHNLILVAEGVQLDGSPNFNDERENRVAFIIGDRIEEYTGHEVREIVLGHVQRGGPPSARDRIWASQMGAKAIEALIEDQSGCMVARRGEKLRLIPYNEVWQGKVEVEKSLYRLAHIIG